MTTFFDVERFAKCFHVRSLGISLREIADQIGISQPTLSRTRRGNQPDVETFFAVCAWMSLSPALFMRDAPEYAQVCPACAEYQQRLAQIAEIAA